MAYQLETEVPYGGQMVTVRSDSVKEFHQLVAGFYELEHDIEFLKQRGARRIVPSYRQDNDDHEYFSFRCADTGKDKTLGQAGGHRTFPFFPRKEHYDKGTGYYDPSENGQTPPRQPAPQPPPAQAPPQQSGSPGREAPCNSEQQNRIGELCQEAGITSAGAATALFEKVIGRPVQKRSELTRGEAGRVIEQLEREAHATKQASTFGPDDDLPF